MQSDQSSFKKKNLISQNDKIEDFYTIEDKSIGSGSYGVIKIGIHKLTKHRRAIKELLKHRIDNLTDFRKEIEILRLLDYPGVIKLFEWYEDDSKVYLVMEHCCGGDLYDRIDRVKQFTEHDARILFKQMISSVNYCHKNNIIHRDLKPENFLFLSNEIDSPLKLIDFGISKMFSSKVETKVGRLKSKVGTSYYIAPEVLQGNYNYLCDIWSCGIILYILLCGYAPFGGDNDNEIFANILKGQLIFHESFWGHISNEVKNLLTKMICKEESRLTAEQILDHPWLKATTEKSPIDLLPIKKKLNTFRASQKLQKAVLFYIASHINYSEVLKLKNIFLSMDKNCDGQLSYSEFCQAFKGIYNANELKELMKSMDLDEDGFVNYTEFLAATISENIYLKEDQIHSTFNSLDKDKNHKISCKELMSIIASELKENEKAFFQNLIQEIDTNKDGEIDFSEFTTMMYRLRKNDS